MALEDPAGATAPEDPQCAPGEGVSGEAPQSRRDPCGARRGRRPGGGGLRADGVTAALRVHADLHAPLPCAADVSDAAPRAARGRAPRRVPPSRLRAIPQAARFAGAKRV